MNRSAYIMVRKEYVKPELNVELLLNHNILLSSDVASDDFADPWDPWAMVDIDDPGMR